MIISKKIKMTVLTAALISLMGCGGSSSKDDSHPSTPAQQGRVVDGPLAAALLTFTNCNSATVETDSDGFFQFPAGCSNSVIVARQGLDTATGLSFNGLLSAPAQNNVNGIIFVTPISSLIQARVASGTPLATANQEIITALGLGSINPLTTDPMKNQQLYVKNATVQQLVEEIQSTLNSLAISSSPQQLSDIVFQSLQQALVKNNPNSIKDVATIQDALQDSLSAVRTQLPQASQQNFEHVQQNLASLTVPLMIQNMAAVETNLNALSPTQFNAGTSSILAASGSLVTAKQSLNTEKLLESLKTLLVLPPAQSQSLFTQLTTLVNSNQSSNISVLSTVLSRLQTLADQAQITVNLNQSGLAANLINPNAFYSRYLQLKGAEISGKNFTASNLINSLQSNTTATSLDGILLEISGVGQVPEQTVRAEAGLEIRSETQHLRIEAKQVDMQFDTNGALTQAVLASGSQLRIYSKQKSNSESVLILNNDVNLLENGKVALNSQVLSRLSASLANQFKQINFAGETAYVTAVFNSTGQPLAIENDNKLSIASNYHLSDNLHGAGLNAKLKITP